MVGSRFFIINRITRQSLQGLVMNMNKLFIPLLLVTVFLAVSCSDDEPKDVESRCPFLPKQAHIYHGAVILL